MESHEETTDLLDTTMTTLTTDVAAMTPQSGKGVIDQWIDTLSESENTKDIVNLLQQLKTQLESGEPNPEETGKILFDLATQTHELGVTVGPEGDMPPRLEALAATLQTTAGQLANA